jgi:23S rRNA pseudouridine2605 synthase
MGEVMVDHSGDPTAPSPSRQDGDAPAEGAGGGDRVAKALARAGVGSRRDVERYIAAGRIRLNGQVLDTPAVRIGPDDVLLVDGRPVSAAEPTRVWRYHKPVGLVTSHRDPQGRPTVFEALPPGLPRVISIGRLDLNSEGLLLLTNDGRLSRALESPATGWVRRYRVRAYGRTSQEQLDRLRDGITVEGVHYGPIEARLDKVQRKAADTETSSANCWITVALTEGKNREVRRVLDALGLKVNRLQRLAYGPFALATLPMGALEEVGPRVIREQLAAFIAPEDLPTGERVISAPVVGRRPGAAVPVGDGGVKPAKKDYKPGWARPAKKARPHPAPKRKAAAGPAPDAVIHARPALPSSPAKRGKGTARSAVEGAASRSRSDAAPRPSGRGAPSVTGLRPAPPPPRGGGGQRPPSPRKPRGK